MKTVESFKAGSTISAYRIVTPSANHTVALASTTTGYPIGVTQNDVTDTNEAIPVVTHGRALLYFNDTVAAGALVTTDASGRGVPLPGTMTSTANHFAVGVLIGAAVATTGTIAEVYVNPGTARS